MTTETPGHSVFVVHATFDDDTFESYCEVHLTRLGANHAAGGPFKTEGQTGWLVNEHELLAP